MPFRIQQASHVALDAQHVHQFLHRSRGLMQRCLLFRLQLYFDNLLDTLRTQLHRHAHE
jgi:hypothetical protein